MCRRECKSGEKCENLRTCKDALRRINKVIMLDVVRAQREPINRNVPFPNYGGDAA